jgi:hypothetical protein
MWNGDAPIAAKVRQGLMNNAEKIQHHRYEDDGADHA